MVKILPSSNRRDLVGHRSGRLLVIRSVGTAPDGHALWECRCDCGAKRFIKSQSLVRATGGTKSCGCLRREVSSRPKRAWNKGLSYSIDNPDGSERVYRQKHSWAKAAMRIKGNACEVCGWNLGRCDVHHLLSRGKGGKHTISNALVVCPNCHRLMHEGKVSHELHKPVQRHRSGDSGGAPARLEARRVRRS